MRNYQREACALQHLDPPLASTTFLLRTVNVLTTHGQYFDQTNEANGQRKRLFIKRLQYISSHDEHRGNNQISKSSDARHKVALYSETGRTAWP